MYIRESQKPKMSDRSSEFMFALEVSINFGNLGRDAGKESGEGEHAECWRTAPDSRD